MSNHYPQFYFDVYLQPKWLSKHPQGYTDSFPFWFRILKKYVSQGNIVLLTSPLNCNILRW